jgi:hypothetical protein
VTKNAYRILMRIVTSETEKEMVNYSAVGEDRKLVQTENSVTICRHFCDRKNIS